MKKNQLSPAETLLYYRLIALWVINEALLGGIIHGLRLPVSGLVVGSFAVICISLIAWYIPYKGAIIKATLVVAVFKMLLSPHAPLPAYLAVFFQGVMGELLFYNRRFFQVSCALLGVLSLLESALQRIIVVTIIYGEDIWKGLNELLNNITGQKVLTDYSFFIIIVYTLLHIVVGLIVGLWAGRLPQQIKFLGRARNQYLIVVDDDDNLAWPAIKRNRWKIKALFVIWIAVVLLYLQSQMGIGQPLLPANMALKIVIRSVIIILSWILIIGPLLKRVLNNWLQKKKEGAQQDVEQVLKLLPATKQLLLKSWQLAGRKKGWNRLMLFGKIILTNTFFSHNA